MWLWYARYSKFINDYDGGAFSRWSDRQKKIVGKVREFIGLGNRGIVFCEDEFVKDVLKVEYGIKSEKVLDGWFLMIN